jgi:catalase
MSAWLAVASTARAEVDNSPAQTPSSVALVDSLNGVFGKQTDGRAIQAKGIVLLGEFVSSKTAASLSKAAHLNGQHICVTVRFFDFAGIPAVSDTDGLATPRGIAVKFALPNGTQTDIVARSFNGFPTKTAEQFRELMIALGSGAGKPPPTPADTFMAAHPIAKSFFDHLPPPPSSYATVAHYGVNSFRFSNAKGQSRFGRYQIVPTAGIHYLSKDDVTRADPNYLSTEIKLRVVAAPATFTLQAQLAEPGDVIDDPSVAWPDSRPIVQLGEIRITRVDAQSDAAQRQLMFSPAAVIDGIEPADPMVAARNAAYAVSYQCRHSAQ